MDHCLVPSVVASDITVTSASGVLADQVAEHCVALLTGLLRGLPTFFRQQQARDFTRRPTRDLHHSTIGIVGLGGVGRRIAQVLSPFKTRLLATDYYPLRKPEHVESLWPPERLDDMLPQLDILILSAPLTDKTLGLMNAANIAKMKRGSILINMGRGRMVVERDLVAALESGHLAAAAVDVTEIEPLPAESKLWDQPNVIITPHVAGQSTRRIDDMTNFFCDNIARYTSGRPLRNLLVDKTLGFPPPEQGN
jgi:phosphoglycerate dehydrogenase-like enzyme